MGELEPKEKPKFWSMERIKHDLNKAKGEIDKGVDEYHEKKEESKKKGRKVSRLGLKLTVGITIPVIATATFGFVGLIIGLLAAFVGIKLIK